MKKLFLLGTMVCALGMFSCTKPKDECMLTNFYRAEFEHINNVTISFSHGMRAQLNPPLMCVYEGMLDVITDNEPDGLYHYGVVDDLCSIEKAPKSDGMTAYDWKKDTATSFGTQTMMARTTIAASY